jgi:hypothetical protein
MKKLASMVCALCFSGAVVVSAAESLPVDLSKAFPEEQLFNQTNLGGMKSFMYLTDRQYPELKKQFVEYLGDGWKEENADEYKRMLKQQGNEAKMAGIAVFMHPDIPKKRIGLSLMNVPMGGKSGMLSVLLMDSEK